MRAFAVPLRTMMWVFTPIVSAVTALVKRISPLWTPREKAPQTTTDELRIILEDAEEQGVFTEEEGELIKDAIEFPTSWPWRFSRPAWTWSPSISTTRT